MESADIGLRVTKQGGDRAAIVGAAGSGKSTLANQLLLDFKSEYLDGVAPKTRGRILVVDTKPRWRGQKLANGGSTRRLYKGFAQGDTIPGAVAMTDLADWHLAFDGDINNRVVISQRIDLPPSAGVLWQTMVIEKFFQTQDAKKPSLLYIDEGMDFFGPAGNGKYSDIVQKCVRAGREKGLSTLIGVQRPKNINLQVMTECNVLYLFRINFTEDVKRLREMSYPPSVVPPKDDHLFWYFRDRKVYPKLMKLKR